MANEHYFSAEPTTPMDRRHIQFTLGNREYRLAAAAGVFSADRLDPGTAVLLHKAVFPQRPTPEPLLDLGCGYGPIAIALAVVSGATVYAVDVNRRALALVGENARAAGVEDRVVPASPDEVLESVRFSQIWSNPPIRVGKSELHAMLERWLPRLTPTGVAWLVVSKNLGGDSLHRWLIGRGFVVRRHASQRGYRVLAVRLADRGAVLTRGS